MLTIWDIWHWHKEQNSPNPQRARAFCSKHFAPREFIGWDIPSTKWKASLCHRRHTRHHRWQFNIGGQDFVQIISKHYQFYGDQFGRDHIQSFLEFLLNGSWEAWAIFFQGLAKHESLLDPANPPGLGFASLFRDLAVDPLLTPPRETDMLVIFIHIQHSWPRRLQNIIISSS